MNEQKLQQIVEENKRLKEEKDHAKMNEGKAIAEREDIQKAAQQRIESLKQELASAHAVITELVELDDMSDRYWKGLVKKSEYTAAYKSAYNAAREIIKK